ncbi:MAG: hypothetical protein P8M11_06280 [Planctomycetota bacterium]|nr:hypothetical protein [Planctomycetota bacterium]
MVASEKLLLIASSVLIAGPALASPAQSYEGTGSTFGGRPPQQGDTVPPLIGPTDPAPPEGAPSIPPLKFGTPPDARPWPTTPTAGPGPALGPGAPSTEDIESWVQWWRFNGPSVIAAAEPHGPAVMHRAGDEFFLGRGQGRVARQGAGIPTSIVRVVVAPALLRIVRGTPNTAELSASLIALAKLGSARAGEPLLPELVAFLAHPSLPVAEAATLGIGILGEDRGAATLMELAIDTPVGHGLCGRSSTPVRLRSFAIYGLGLIGARSMDRDLQGRLVAALLPLLETDDEARPDVVAAAITSLGLTQLPWRAAPGQAGLTRPELIRRLWGFLQGDARRVGRTRQAHARAQIPIALARLHQGAGQLHQGQVAETGARLLELLETGSTEESAFVRQSILIALGRLANSGGNGSTLEDLNKRAHAALSRASASAPHELTRRFALIALARQAGRPGDGPRPLAFLEPTEQLLLDRLDDGPRRETQWAALALGVLGDGARRNGQGISPGTRQRLQAALRKSKGPDEVGAIALALGMMRAAPAGPLLLTKLQRTSEARAKGHIALGLGLMGAGGAVDSLMAALERGHRDARLADQLGTALGLVAPPAKLIQMASHLDAAASTSDGATLALAVGRGGHRSGVASLLARLGSGHAQPATALGVACDKDEVPWNVQLGLDVNYGVEIETLRNSERTGILDLL